MIVINDVQAKWMKDNFCLTKKDIPTDWMEAKDFIATLQGKNEIRGVEYQGDGYDFMDDCWLSLTAMDCNKERFNIIFRQLDNYWIPEAVKLEYYELLFNLNYIKNEFKRFVDMANIHMATDEVNALLNELKITKTINL
jgi:hypothetical protein